MTAQDLELNWSKLGYGTGQDSLYDDGIFLTITQLFELPYWSSLWVLQEIVLAPYLFLLFSPKTIVWLAVCAVLFWSEIFRLMSSMSERSKTIPMIDWYLLTPCALWYVS
jgi:hypothetical protein